MSRYPVPAETLRVETRAGNSRFITTIRRADSVAAAHAFLRSIRAEMPDATHHVYAFRVGYGASVAEGMSDDGEPSGTSGPPTLAVLRGADLGDVALVTTRYFGGTKLGTGGLVAAYTAAAKAALAALKTTPRIDRTAYEITIGYAQLEPLRRALRELECIVSDEAFGEDVRLIVLTPDEAIPRLQALLRDLTAGRGEIRPHPPQP